MVLEFKAYSRWELHLNPKQSAGSSEEGRTHKNIAEKNAQKDLKRDFIAEIFENWCIQ